MARAEGGVKVYGGDVSPLIRWWYILPRYLSHLGPNSNAMLGHKWLHLGIARVDEKGGEGVPRDVVSLVDSNLKLVQLVRLASLSVDLVAKMQLLSGWNVETVY